MDRALRVSAITTLLALVLAACGHDSPEPSLAEQTSRVAIPGTGLESAAPATTPAKSSAEKRPVKAGRFAFDQRQTEVTFAYTMANMKQRGRFTEVRGTLDYDEAAPEKSKIIASIGAASLTTGSEIVDHELKGADFFNVAASPVIAFKSITVQPLSATHADVAGEISINGITKPVTLKVSLIPHDDPTKKWDKNAKQFTATTRIQRRAFKMTGWQALVDDDIEIEITAIARPV